MKIVELLSTRGQTMVGPGMHPDDNLTMSLATGSEGTGLEGSTLSGLELFSVANPHDPRQTRHPSRDL